MLSTPSLFGSAKTEAEKVSWGCLLHLWEGHLIDPSLCWQHMESQLRHFLKGVPPKPRHRKRCAPVGAVCLMACFPPFSHRCGVVAVSLRSARTGTLRRPRWRSFGVHRRPPSSHARKQGANANANANANNNALYCFYEFFYSHLGNEGDGWLGGARPLTACRARILRDERVLVAAVCAAELPLPNDAAAERHRVGRGAPQAR